MFITVDNYKQYIIFVVSNLINTNNMATQKERQDFAGSIVKIQENRKPISSSEIIAMRLVQQLQNDNLSFEDMLLAVKSTELRIYQLISLRDLDEKFKGND